MNRARCCKVAMSQPLALDAFLFYFLGQDPLEGVEIIITHMRLITHAMCSSRNIIAIGIIDTSYMIRGR